MEKQRFLEGIVLINLFILRTKFSMDNPLIKDLKVGTKNINLQFIILEVGPPSITKEAHEIRTCKVADRTGCINLSVWGELGTHLQPSDICRLTKGYISLWKGTPTLYIGKGGELVKSGDFCMLFTENGGNTSKC